MAEAVRGAAASGGGGAGACAALVMHVLAWLPGRYGMLPPLTSGGRGCTQRSLDAGDGDVLARAAAGGGAVALRLGRRTWMNEYGGDQGAGDVMAVNKAQRPFKNFDRAFTLQSRVLEVVFKQQ